MNYPTAGVPRFSRVILGTWRARDWGFDATTLGDFIAEVLDAGVTTLDCADIYADFECEAMVGEALARRPELRRQVQLVTKCGIRPVSPKTPEVHVKHYDSSRRYIIGRAEAALSAFRTDRIELMLLHRPDPLMDADEMAEAFCALKQSGKVLAFGVSNFRPSQVEMLQSRLPFPLVANQIELSLLQRHALDDGVLDQCQKMRMMPMAWSPLAGGVLAGAECPAGLGQMLASVALRLGLTREQVALAWLLRLPAQVHVVIGSGRIDRVRLAAAAARAPLLERQDWFGLLEAAQGCPVA